MKRVKKKNQGNFFRFRTKYDSGSQYGNKLVK